MIAEHYQLSVSGFLSSRDIIVSTTIKSKSLEDKMRAEYGCRERPWDDGNLSSTIKASLVRSEVRGVAGGFCIIAEH